MFISFLFLGSSRRWNTPGKLLYMMGYISSHPTCICICTCICMCVCVCLTAFFAFQDTVSVHRPSFYADRFLKFMGSTVFKKIHCKSLRLHNTCTLYFVLWILFWILSLCLLALRGASSKRKRSSLYGVKSVSQEVLSPQREERKEEKKAQSLDNLDGNCKRQITHFTSYSSQHFCHFNWFRICFFAIVYGSSKQPDLLPRSAVSFESTRNDEEDLDNRSVPVQRSDL